MWQLGQTFSGLIQLKCELPTFEQFKRHLLQAGTPDSLRGKGSALLPLITAKIVAAQMKEKKDSILGLATGSTPLGLYNELVKMNQSGEIDFSEIKTFNLDEYYPCTNI